MRQPLFCLIALATLAGCTAAPAAAPVRRDGPAVAAAKARNLDAQLRKDVLVGMRQIFTTYDQAPKDERLTFPEFRVVTQEWFDAYDADADGFLRFEEWHTEAEANAQVEGIVAAGKAHVQAADTNADGVLSLAEHLARTDLEIDPTPWLAGPADPQIRTTAFRTHAPDGKLTVDGATRMVGGLLAYGYYLDDGRNIPLETGFRLPRR